MKKLENALNLYYQHHPESISIQHWSGCNYHINQGNNEVELIGTAQSMHECHASDCKLIDICEIKQLSPIWLYTEEIGKELDEKWKKMKKLN